VRTKLKQVPQEEVYSKTGEIARHPARARHQNTQGFLLVSGKRKLHDEFKKNDNVQNHHHKKRQCTKSSPQKTTMQEISRPSSHYENDNATIKHYNLPNPPKQCPKFA
jgi:hypothetical protein